MREKPVFSVCFSVADPGVSLAFLVITRWRNLERGGRTMNAKRPFRVLGFLLAGWMAGTEAIGAQDFIVMGTPLVNLRTAPSTSATVIGRADKGDIFRVVGEVDGWYKIQMFSSEPRYVIKADFVYPLTKDQLVAGHRMEIPPSTARARSIFRDTEAGLDRAAREAAEVIPVTLNRERHTVLKRILEDRVLLEMFHIHGVQPALYRDLVSEARKEGWG
jgi:hypothetical protein